MRALLLFTINHNARNDDIKNDNARIVICVLTFRAMGFHQKRRAIPMRARGFKKIPVWEDAKVALK